MTDLMRAPFGKEDLKALQTRQSNPKVNRYLCSECPGTNYLQAHEKGLSCPQCGTLLDVVPREAYQVKSKATGKMQTQIRVEEDLRKMKKIM